MWCTFIAMFTREKAIKIKDTTYRYVLVVENKRCRGKVSRNVIVNLGRAGKRARERADQLIRAVEKYSSKTFYHLENFESLSSKSFGEVLAIKSIRDGLEIPQFIKDFVRNRKIKKEVNSLSLIMTVNRLLYPESKLFTSRWYKRIFLEEVRGKDFNESDFYRAMDYLIQMKEPLERYLWWKMVDLFSLKLNPVFYDITSTHFEGICCNLAEFGHSRDHRPDKLQIVIAVVVTDEGVPIAHDVFPGNTADLSTVREAIDTLRKRFDIKRCIFVSDNGMVSAENLDYISGQKEDASYQYIVGIRKRSCKDVKEFSTKSLNDYIKLQDNLWAKRINYQGRDYIICYNKDKAEDDKAFRSRRPGETEDEIALLNRQIQKNKTLTEEDILTKAGAILQEKRQGSISRFS